MQLKEPYNILSSYDDVMGDNYSHTKYNIMYKDKRGHACGGMLKMKRLYITN